MSETFVILPTGEFEITYLKESFWDLKIIRFEYQDYKPRPALIDKSGGVSRPYVGQKFDPKYIDLIQDGWTHDHCEICHTKISADENDKSFTSGYFNDGIWVCIRCYELIISADDIERRLAELSKVEK